MKSITIIYKQTSLKEMKKNKTEGILGKRIYDNQFATSLEKEEKNLQNRETYTSRGVRIKDKTRIYSSLNINSYRKGSTQTDTFIQQRGKSQKLVKHSTKKSQKILQTLKLPTYDFEESPIERLRMQEFSRHSKVKIIGKVRKEKEHTLVLAVDLILKEDNFWGEDEIDDNALRAWKKLNGIANLIWLIKRESSARKLIAFCKQENLRIDGIIKVEPSHRQTLKISYYNLEKQLKLQKNQKLFIINTLHAGDIKDMKDFQFRNSLPLINHSNSYIHFIKIQKKNENNKLATVIKLLGRNLPQSINLAPYFESFDKRRRQQKHIQEEQFDQQEILQEIDRCKSRLCKEFDQGIGLTTKIAGNSVQFLIGDMLRRNYKFFRNFHQIQARGKQSPFQKTTHKAISYSYHRAVFIWEGL